LLLTSGGLLAVWWLGSDSASGPADNRRNPTVAKDAGSARVLKELTVLRDARNLRDFTRDAGELIGRDQTLSAEELKALGEDLFGAGYPGTAELCFRKALAQAKSDESATLNLARLLYATGRVEEARSYLTGLLRTGKIDLECLPMLGNSELVWRKEAKAIQMHDHQTSDVDTLWAKAWIGLQQQEIDLAVSLLNAAEAFPTSAGNRQQLLLRAECFSRSGKKAELTELLADSSPEMRTMSDNMLCLQGQLCLSLGETEPAIRCFWEAFRIYPNSYAECSQLAEFLEMKQSIELAAQLRVRSKAIREYQDICSQIHLSDFPVEKQLAVAATAAAKLNCLRESMAWCVIAEQAYPKAAWTQEQKTIVQAGIDPTDQRFSQLEEWIAGQDFSSYPLPDWHQLRSRISSDGPDATTPLVFSDDAITSEIQFQYQDAAIADSDTTRLFEFTGGGVAALDADLDGWPDVFFTQGGNAPALGNPTPSSASASEASPKDQLFRNLRGQSFSRVTEAAKLIDGGYSQGCASGDIDMDGFPDLYIANIGQNQLFRNNGDGTFDGVSLPRSETWTTSCAIADVTGDGIPDIYDVNHFIPAAVHQKMCRKKGVAVPCDSSDNLVAEQDRMYAGDGEGGFVDITDSVGIRTKDGLGLGLVVLRLGDDEGLSIFVANDARPNFLFVKMHDANPQNDGLHLLFSDEAIVRGVAFSGTGRAQACMGVAAGDANGDGTTDLFVTNYFEDNNTLYLQQSEFFHDSSESANLVQSSYSMLGFGTQFLDGDLDGDLDLVVTNGDVVDFSQENPSRLYAQRLQIFRNRSDGSFDEQPAEISGSLFRTKCLGRGLAKLDWNADGSPDFVASNIRSPALLATNRTADTGHYLELRLTGIQSPRHPIGAIVRVTTTNGELQGQLTAGDGYQACNENSLLFGLGRQTQPVTVTLQWPSGRKQILPSIPADSRQTIIEGKTSFSTHP